MPDNNNNLTLTDLFTGVANAIRTKKGTNALIAPTSFATEIANLPSGSTGFSSVTISSLVNSTNVGTADKLCVIWSSLSSGANGSIYFEHGEINYFYCDNMEGTRSDCYVWIVDEDYEEVIYWRDNVNSIIVNVPFRLGNYVSHNSYHTAGGNSDLNASILLLRCS